MFLCKESTLPASGRRMLEGCSVPEADWKPILEFLAGLRGTLSLTFEEGTWAAWLIVCNPRKNTLLKQGKSDKIDARKLADRLRLHDLKPVYHGETGVRMLRELAAVI